MYDKELAREVLVQTILDKHPEIKKNGPLLLPSRVKARFWGIS